MNLTSLLSILEVGWARICHPSPACGKESMSVIESKVDTNSPQFQQNREGMLKYVADWRAVEAKGRAEEESKRERFHKRKQLLPRERVHLLLDRGSPWLALS